ncbi:hypothetical protein BCV72DRAFT_101667, partial [Rhizopus microsporus var. microsporus]
MTNSAYTAQLLENIINLYLTKENALVKNLSFILESVVNHDLLNEVSASNEEMASLYKKWVTRLNSLLQSKNAAVRLCAITLIRTTCERSHTLLVANAKSWSAQLLGFIGKTEADAIHKESIEALNYIFGYTHDKPELHREVATPNMPRYNQLLLQLAQKEALLPTVLSALTANNAQFPSNSKHIAEQTLQLCLSCLDGSRDLDQVIAQRASKCLASLYRTGNKATMADQWRDMLLRLIGSVHQCLNRLFDTVDEESFEFDASSSYPFRSVERDYVEAFPLLLKRVQLLQDSISTFLTTATHVPVRVPVVQLVDLLCRIYNVFDGSLMRDYKDRSEFFSVMMCLPTLHFNTTKVFSSLLYCTGQEMFRYSKLFSKILHRLLTEYKHKRTLRLSVYKLIRLCLEKCGYTFAENFTKPLIAAILEDLQTVKHKPTSLVMPSQQKGSHKKRKTEVTNSDSITSRLVSSASGDVQAAALQTLATFLDVFGFALENAQRASIDSTVLMRLLQTVQPSNMSSEEVNLVKVELYNCLLASVTRPMEAQASILPHAVRLFTAGMNDSTHELQTICKRGLTICDLITHARLPPIQRALPKESPVVQLDAPVVEKKVEKKAVEMVREVDNGPQSKDREATDIQVQRTSPKEPPVVHWNTPAVEKKVEKIVAEEVKEESQSKSDESMDLKEEVPVFNVPVLPKESPIAHLNTVVMEEEAEQTTIEVEMKTAEEMDAQNEEPQSKDSEAIDIEEEMPAFDIPDIDMAGPDSDVEDDE